MRDPRRDLVWVIAIVALALRLSFVLTSPARALYWDERFYQSVATGYLRALGDAAEPTLADAIRAGLYKGEVYSVTVALTTPPGPALETTMVYVLKPPAVTALTPFVIVTFRSARTSACVLVTVMSLAFSPL
jgi:hypothetical protein